MDPFRGGTFDEVIVKHREGGESAPHVPVVEDVSELAVYFGAFVTIVTVPIGKAERLVVGTLFGGALQRRSPTKA